MTDRDMKSFNDQVIAEFRANGGKVGGPFEGAPMVLLTTKGAKSGRSHTTPVVYSRDDDRVVVIASKAGAPQHPAWYHNLAANPDVEVELGTERFAARATVAEGGERRRLYDAHAELMPTFNEYEEKTTREIPVVLLERAG